MKKPKIGDKVDYHSLIGGPVTSTGHTVDSEPYIMCGTLVASITGKAGCVDVDALTLTPIEGQDPCVECPLEQCPPRCEYAGDGLPERSGGPQ